MRKINYCKGLIWSKPLTREMWEFQDKTGKSAVYRGTITGQFEYWLQQKEKREKEQQSTIVLLDNALTQLEIAEKERKLNPAQQKRRAELKRRKKAILEKTKKEKTERRSTRKQKYQTASYRIEQFTLKKQQQEKLEELNRELTKKKINLPRFKKEFEKTKKKHKKISESISKEAQKEWEKNKYEYKYTSFKGWNHPEEIKTIISLKPNGNLYKEFRKAYEDYYLTKGSIERLEKKILLLKKHG